MHTFHTAGVPPSFGKTIFANIGSTTNKSALLRKSVRLNRISKTHLRNPTVWARAVASATPAFGHVQMDDGR
jgi:hypothetical protein